MKLRCPYCGSSFAPQDTGKCPQCGKHMILPAKIRAAQLSSKDKLAQTLDVPAGAIKPDDARTGDGKAADVKMDGVKTPDAKPADVKAEAAKAPPDGKTVDVETDGVKAPDVKTPRMEAGAARTGAGKTGNAGKNGAGIGRGTEKKPPVSEKTLRNQKRFVLVMGTACLILLCAIVHKCQNSGERAILKQRMKKVVKRLSTIDAALEKFRADCGRYPTTEEGMQALIKNFGIENWNGPYVEKLYMDPWGSQYEYYCSDGTTRLFSHGPDTVGGTKDDILSKGSRSQPAPAPAKESAPGGDRTPTPASSVTETATPGSEK